MKYTDAMHCLQQHQLSRAYLLAGAETYLKEQFLSALLKIINPDGSGDTLQQFDAQSDIKAILQSADSPPFFSENNIIIAKELKLFADKPTEKDKRDAQLLADYLTNVPDFSVLIFTAQAQPDKRRRLTKAFHKYGSIVECEPLAYWNVSGWLNQRLRQLQLHLDREAYAYLSEAIKAMGQISLGFIDQELRKLVLYAGQKQVNRQMLEQILSSMPEISSFRLWDALCEKNIAAVLGYYAIQKEAGLYPLRLLALLARQMRQLWQVKLALADGQQPRQLAASLKVPPFIAEKIAAQSRRFTLGQIEKGIELIADADYKLKTGHDEPALLENIFITLCC